MKDQSIFSVVIISIILITLSLDNVYISLGENRCWSPLIGAYRVMCFCFALQVFIPEWPVAEGWEDRMCNHLRKVSSSFYKTGNASTFS